MRSIPESIRILYFANTSDEPYVEIVTVKQQKRHSNFCSSLDFESEDLLPVLTDHSHILKEHHIDKLLRHIPARTQEYHWKLVYSTAEHGTSLRTLYRHMTHIDRPVLMVIKDMDNQVFGAFSSDPFKVSSYCYGTGETFLYSFSPEFQVCCVLISELRSTAARLSHHHMCLCRSSAGVEKTLTLSEDSSTLFRWELEEVTLACGWMLIFITARVIHAALSAIVLSLSTMTFWFRIWRCGPSYDEKSVTCCFPALLCSYQPHTSSSVQTGVTCLLTFT